LSFFCKIHSLVILFNARIPIFQLYS